ncbi:MAG: hypothetical protein WCH43_00255 [Verrucomicrobiota bacterium]
MTLEPGERSLLEDERRLVENELHQMNGEIERLGAGHDTTVQWLQAKRNLVEARLNTIKVKLGIW